MLGRLQKVAQSSVEASAAYKKALEIDPDNEDAMTGLAMVYADQGDTTAAADLLKKLATKNPTPRSLQALAIFCGFAAGAWLGGAEAPIKLVNPDISPITTSLTSRSNVPSNSSTTRRAASPEFASVTR